jgi:hypothetical protein
MKLYTEEQVQEAYNRGHMDGRLNNIDYSITDVLAPIELPSEYEIEESSFKMSGNNVSPSSNFMIGAYWMKEKIQGGNK